MEIKLLSSEIPQSVQDLTKILLENRQIQDTKAFLHPKSPLDFSLKEVGIDAKQMTKAVARIEAAKEKQESIIIFGDYDCDGVCATAVLWEALYGMGCKVLPFIPNRETHGYGLSDKALDEILSQGKPDLLISVDNGIVSHAQWQRLKDLGISTILTDHHLSDGKVSPADIIIHTTSLCGTTVAWMLARSLAPEKAAQTLDLCAVATVADQVPLLDANRSFVQFGLKELNATKRIGLQLLIEAAGLTPGEISTYSINFGIAPRINAIGRLGSALDALRALCTKNRQKVQALVSKLHDTNAERQILTKDLLDIARSKAADWENERIIVVADERFHEGIIGLIAGRLAEEYYKPSIVLSLGKVTSKGSSRSIEGVHITEFLRDLKDEVLEVGGHPLAAGLLIETKHLDRFVAAAQNHAREVIDLNVLHRFLTIDCEIPGSLATLETATVLAQFEPFGAQNREPIFLIRNLTMEKMQTIGKEGRHVKVTLKNANPIMSLQAIGFGMAGLAFESGEKVDCCGFLKINVWKGRTSLQFQLKDIVPASTD